MTDTAKKCAHPACNCTVADGKKFCSDICHDAKNMLEIACQCHHAGCQGEALRH